MDTLDFEQAYRERQRSRRTKLTHLVTAMRNLSQDPRTSTEMKGRLELKINEALTAVEFINGEVGDLHDKQK
jgi:hypothetical protein